MDPIRTLIQTHVFPRTCIPPRGCSRRRKPGNSADRPSRPGERSSPPRMPRLSSPHIPSFPPSALPKKNAVIRRIVRLSRSFFSFPQFPQPEPRFAPDVQTISCPHKVPHRPSSPSFYPNRAMQSVLTPRAKARCTYPGKPPAWTILGRPPAKMRADWPARRDGFFLPGLPWE